MELHRVQSSVLAAVGYDPDRSVLEARFRTGRIYHYFDVPPGVFETLLAAPSAGRFFNKAIRDRYRAELVYDPEHSTRLR
jgi:hypothetical protein